MEVTAVDPEGTVMTAGRYRYGKHLFYQLASCAVWELQEHYQNNVNLLQSCKLSLYEHLLTCDILQILDQDLVINRYLICSPLSQRGILPEWGQQSQVLHSHIEYASKIFLGKTLQFFLLQKQNTKGITQQTCAHMIKGKLHPLCSVRDGILTHYFN